MLRGGPRGLLSHVIYFPSKLPSAPNALTPFSAVCGERYEEKTGSEKEVQRQMQIRKATEVPSPEDFLAPCMLAQRKKSRYHQLKPSVSDVASYRVSLSRSLRKWASQVPAPIDWKGCL